MPIHGIRTVYQPFSLQERMAPLAMMKEEYDKINEGIALLGETANQYYQFLDPAAKQEIDAYNAKLDSVAGSLASEGMKAVSRNTLNDLRRQYNGRIKHIQEAAQTVGTMQAQIREMQMKDPTLMVQSVPSVSDILKDPNARPSVISGAQLMQDGATAALALPGVTYDQLSRYLSGDTSAIPDLNKTAQTIANNYGTSTEEAFAYIQRGIVSGLGKRATELDMKQQQIDMQFQKEMAMARYNQGQQNYRQQQQLNASREAREYQMIRSGWVPDASVPGGWRFDKETAEAMAQAKAAGRTTSSKTTSSSSRSSTQYMHRTKGTVGYNPDGTRSKTQDIPSDATLINDISKATTEEKALALKHAGVPIEDCRKAGSDGYNEDAINNKVAENMDVLGAYRFWTTSKGSGNKKKTTGFWGTDTAVEREVEDSYYGGGYSAYPGYVDMEDAYSSLNELPEELI